jgi:hypothetical protein
MKSLIVGGLSLILISAANMPTLRAETTAYNPAASGKTQSYLSTTPVNLVSLAYQGYLQDQGIPSYNDLITAYHERQISAEDIVRSGVKAKRLPEQVLSDKGYINAVKAQLDNFRIY